MLSVSKRICIYRIGVHCSIDCTYRIVCRSPNSMTDETLSRNRPTTLVLYALDATREPQASCVPRVIEFRVQYRHS